MRRPVRAARGTRASRIAWVAALAVSATAASPIVVRHDRTDAEHLELGERFGPGLVHMNLEGPGEPPDGEGTLIAPRWVLTAAHVAVEVEPGHTVSIAGREYAAAATFLHPDWDDGASDDIGLVRLVSPVRGVEPLEPYRDDDESGRVVTVVGRGDFGTGETGPTGNDGRVRGATNRVDGANAKLLWWRFDAPGDGGVTRLEGVSGPGDSGGPALIEVDGRRWVVGVSSAQSTRATAGREGVYGVTEYYVRVSGYVDWIERVIAENGPPDPAEARVRYTVTPVRTDSRVHLRVEAAFRGAPEGATRFALPSDRFGAGETHRWVRDVDPGPGVRLALEEPGVYTARHEPGAAVEVSYTVAYDPEAAGFVAFGPSVGPDHFHFFGSQWMARAGPADGPRHIEVTFETDGWTGAVGSSYGLGPGPHRVTATDRDLDYSVIAGGSYRTARSTCRGRPVLTMVRGGFDVADREIFTLADRIVCGQRQAFDDLDRPFFTVFITERDGLRAGAPLLHGFTAFLEPDVSREELRGLLAHEMIHTWLPRTARLVDPERPDASEVPTRWFHEGFTEYLARLVLVRQELAPLSWMVELTNRDLARLARHPYRTLTLEELERAAEEGRYNSHHHRLHYLRGALLALNWDARIRAGAGGERSLLDAIRDVVRRAKASDGTIGLPAFTEVLGPLGIDVGREVERYLHRGEPLAPAEDAFAPAYELDEVSAPAFEPGLDLVALIETDRVAGLRPDGPAERAGLREGMRVVATENAAPWRGSWDPERPTVVVVETPDGDRRRFEVRAAGAPIALPRFVPTGRAGARRPDTAALAREIPRLLEVGNVPGLSIAVVDEGSVLWTGAFGTLGDSAGTPVNEQTIFSAASLSKPVFAYAVLRLAERGEIDLDRPLAELLDYPRVTHDPRGRRITPRMVLSHGTGLPNWGGERLELQFDPGEGFDYSGEGFVYLQRAVERVTGGSLEELARREVFGPLGMTRSSYVWRERFAGEAAHGKDRAWRVEPVDRYEEPNAAYSLLTTARDYGRFLAAVLNGTGLAEETRRMMLAPERPARRPSRRTPADDHVSWGLGWGLQEGPAGRAFWHWGDNGRFKAYVAGYFGDGTGVVYFANGHDGLSIAEAIVSRVVDDDHRALRWLDYGRHDDPERLAVKAVQRAAVEEGGEAALARYRALRADPDDRPGLDAALDVASFLEARDLDGAGRSVLELAARDHPDSARVQGALAEARLEAGDYEAALAAQRRAVAAGPGDEDARRRARWIEERIAVRDRPVTVRPSLLERYVGDYGPRRVWLEDGTLRYRREDNPAYRLVPLSDDLFAVEGLETFRVRFLGAGSGPAAAIEGVYFDGTRDRTERDDPGARDGPAGAPDGPAGPRDGPAGALAPARQTPVRRPLVRQAVAPEAAVDFGAPVHVSAAREDLPHIEPHLARDPTDPQRLLAVSMVYHESGAVARPGVYRSGDGGATWRAVTLAESVTAIDPRVTFDREGAAYFLHLPGRVHISVDGGEKWAPPVDLPTDGIGSLDFPKLVADLRPGPQGGRVYVVSASAERDPAGLLVGPVYVFRSAPDGDFERTARILPAWIDYQITTGPVVLPDGRLAVGFSELSHGGELLPPGRIWITRSEDAGSHFPPPSLVTADGGGNVSMAVDRSGGPFHGRLYLAFLRLEDWNLLLTLSDDGGLTWSEPVRINDAPYRRLTAPIHPMLAVDDRGVLGILWPDHRDDEQQRCYAVRFAYSADGGESVSPNLAVPETRNCPDRPGGNRMLVDRPDGRPVVDRYPVGGDYYGLTGGPDGGFHALWSDARTGVFQLWSTTIEVAGAASPSLGVDAALHRRHPALPLWSGQRGWPSVSTTSSGRIEGAPP